MLLRTITKHVREQNWFAVALDFFIVVTGILIAFQITNWNEARVDARSERVLLERLHDEITQAQAIDKAASELFINERLENLISARHAVFGIDEQTELTDAQCQSIAFSHYPQARVIGIPILSELRSTGETTLIRDETIVREIAKLTDLFDSGYGFEESNRLKITLLSRDYPELVSIGLKKPALAGRDFDVDPYDVFYTCDFAAMRASAAFRGAFGENVSLQLTLLEFAILPVRQSLADLLAALDEELGSSAIEEAR